MASGLGDSPELTQSCSKILAPPYLLLASTVLFALKDDLLALVHMNKRGTSPFGVKECKKFCGDVSGERAFGPFFLVALVHSNIMVKAIVKPESAKKPLNAYAKYVKDNWHRVAAEKCCGSAKTTKSSEIMKAVAAQYRLSKEKK